MVYVVSYQKSLTGHILQGLRMHHVGVVYGHLEHLPAIWNIILQFGIFYRPFGILYCNLVYFTSHLVYFAAVWYILRLFGIVSPYVLPREIWQP
jgi:hypothetical protein